VSDDARTAVVTGGARGIGLSIARRLLSAGLNVVVSDVDEAALAEAVTSSSSNQLRSIRADVTEPSSMQDLATAAVDAFGGVDVLCCNAGVGGSSPISADADDLDAWRHVFDVNVFGVVNTVHAFLPILRKQSNSHIVITASRTGLVPTPYTGAYGSSKFAVVAIGEMLGAELLDAGDDVAVTILCPGAVQTDLAQHGAAARGADPRLAALHEERAKSAISAELLTQLLTSPISLQRADVNRATWIQGTV